MLSATPSIGASVTFQLNWPGWRCHLHMLPGRRTGTAPRSGERPAGSEVVLRFGTATKKFATDPQFTPPDPDTQPCDSRIRTGRGMGSPRRVGGLPGRSGP